MNQQELLDAITTNFADLQGGLSWGEFLFGIGLDGSSLKVGIQICKVMRDPDFKRLLRESGIGFSLERNGKLHFVEVTNVG